MKINIRKCLLACMASMTLISFTAYGSEQSDQDQILREIAERIAASGDILDKIQEGAPWEDVQKLVEILRRLSDGGNTVVVIEHNLDVIKTADYIIDIGPEGGDGGGTVVAKGTPEEVAKNPASHTGRYVAKYLK